MSDNFVLLAAVLMVVANQLHSRDMWIYHCDTVVSAYMLGKSEPEPLTELKFYVPN